MSTQEHVSETLRRAVATDRVGHAYLFCGPRGVGKTTLARVLAMALNCPDRDDEGEPCGKCESCLRIWGGQTALDVVEIDAASNRGVDDARDLRERAMYSPSADGRTKVYIVDEAHMLTREAWNALLKILEEPPPRVIFIFATTEPQKIQQAAAPILSRCQRFDFRRIGVADIVAQLERILGEEDAEAPEEALRVIARKADGGMRDALSLLDQILSLTGGDVDLESVRRVLGLVEEERYVELLDILAERRHEQVFALVQELVDEGYDLVEFHHGLLDVLRTLLRLRLAPDADVDLAADMRSRLMERTERFAPGDLVRMLSAASDLESRGSLRKSPNPRLPIEMLLLRMSFLDRTVSLEELIGALGGAPSSGDAGPRGPAGAGGSTSAAGASGGSGAGGTSPTKDGAAASTATAERKVAGRPSPEPASHRSEDVPPTSPEAATPASAGEDAAPASSREAAASSKDPAPTPSSGPAPAPSVEPGSASSEEDGAAPSGKAAAPPTGDVAEAWSRWLDDADNLPAGLRPFLHSARVDTDAEGRIVVRPMPGPALERIAEPAIVAHIAEGLARHLGRRPAVVVEAPGDAMDPDRRVTVEEVRSDTLKALYRQEPRLERAVEELDLELMD